ncbi:IS110 family transposase [Arthrobacter mobilis]|uniref:IS110 family transposase n=1 Tax=Arthrobacter mobilis TaxID=2724944 RepID=A0A7X6HHK1_9MICC|nr:IS110 family transposase [Arthrobacter mobilis]NKX56196.1 IS110 family transposase [Arthrobacter mobilis]
MDVLHERCAGIDISKRDAKVCVRRPGRRRGQYTSTVATWGSTTNEVLALREHLLHEQVTLVVMEATGDYWKQFYFLLEDGLNVMLTNAQQVKNMPGRKTDVSDAAWLAQLGAFGLVRASFVPPEPVRQLRDLTRTRTMFIRQRGSEIQRLEKLLEDAGIKLSSVATDLTGVSSRAMLGALIEGERDPAVLADLAVYSLRAKIPALAEALNGRFNAHHAFLAGLHLDIIDGHTRAIEELGARIEQAIDPFRPARDLLMSIPGVSGRVAEVIIAETGADMSVFPTAAHLASWSGTAPGNNESAGRIKSGRTRAGNPYLKGALGIAVLAGSRSKKTYFGAKYRRLAARRGPMKALVAVEHAILTAVWNMLRTGELYKDPGPDYFTRLQPAKTRARAVSQLEAMGFTVTIEPAQQAG